MRLTSELWVQALIRQVNISGGFCTLERRGNADAGAIYIRALKENGMEDYFVPAMQAVYEPGKVKSRQFECVRNDVDRLALNELLEKEIKFDQDIWIVEMDIKSPEQYFEIATN